MQPIMPVSLDGKSLPVSPVEKDLDWISSCLSFRITQIFGDTPPVVDALPMPPELDPGHSPYAQFVHEKSLNLSERVALALAMAVELRPGLLLDLAQRGQGMPELGLHVDSNSGLVSPSVRTLLFVLGGLDLGAQTNAARNWYEKNRLETWRIIDLREAALQEVHLYVRFQLSREGFHKLVLGHANRPEYSSDFPAKLLDTTMVWDDLILPNRTRKQVEDVRLWLDHRTAMMEELGMDKFLNPGYRALFYGPSGTGKTLTATLLGKLTGREVYRIDLSQIVSKYIGETEKNLSRIFDFAERGKWILFFDEADSLFGKRGQVSDARDRYANQEVSYLLQRIEDFDGLCILASNLKDNIDPAFARRLESVVHFPAPKSEQRAAIWQRALPPGCTLEEGLNPHLLGQKYELTGGAIMNLVRYAVLMALHRGDRIIRQIDVQEGAMREYNKVGRLL